MQKNVSVKYKLIYNKKKLKIKKYICYIKFYLVIYLIYIIRILNLDYSSR